MRILITGGAGFLGRRLTLELLRRGRLVPDGGPASAITRIVLFDLAEPQQPLPDDPRVTRVRGDIRDPEAVARAVTADTVAVFHLSAVVSGGAEQDFDLGLAVNVHGMQHLLQACRRLPAPPRLVFASSIAVYGGDVPAVVEDDTALTPQTSYGTHKAIGELLVNDYSRKGFIDGRCLRLPTIVARPGKPNAAASAFASSIVREPLQGRTVDCPVSPETAAWVLSPRRAVEAFIQACELPADAWEPYRAIALPGICMSVAQTVGALREVAGDRVAERVRFKPDPFIERIVATWPTRFAPKRAEALGFRPDGRPASIVEAFIEDELGGAYVA